MKEHISVTYKSTVKCLYCDQKRNCLEGCHRYLEVKANLKVFLKRKGKKLKTKTIGQSLITIYDRNLFPDITKMFDLNEVTVHALDEIKNFYKQDQVAIIEILHVNEKHRKKGAGGLLMKDIQEYLFDVLRLPITLLLAAPFEEKVTYAEIDDYVEFLVSFYQKFGYTDFLDNFMLCTKKRYQFLKQRPMGEKVT